MTILERVVIVEKFGVISGVCAQLLATLGLPSLYEALHIAFQKSSYVLFIIGSVCSAVFKRRDGYCFFYSHSHGPDGLSCPDGESLLISFTCLEELVSFMYAVYDSMLIDISEQFDMLPVDFKLRSENQTSYNFSRCVTTNEVCETAISEEIRQSNNSGLGTNSRQNEIKSGKAMESKSKMNLMKIKKMKSNNEETKIHLLTDILKTRLIEICVSIVLKVRLTEKYINVYTNRSKGSLFFLRRRKGNIKDLQEDLRQ